jgi:hypothetical protein
MGETGMVNAVLKLRTDDISDVAAIRQGRP